MADKKTVLEWGDENGLTPQSEIDHLRAKLAKMEAAGDAMQKRIQLMYGDPNCSLAKQWQEAKR